MLTTNSPSAKVALQSAVTSELKPLPITEASPASLITESNGTLRHKATERYIFGWSDPRGIYGTIDSFPRSFEDVRMLQKHTFATDMTDEQLRAAWIIYFGTDGIDWRSVQDHEIDEFCVAFECWQRGIVGRLMRNGWETELYGLKDGNR